MPAPGPPDGLSDESVTLTKFRLFSPNLEMESFPMKQVPRRLVIRSLLAGFAGLLLGPACKEKPPAPESTSPAASASVAAPAQPQPEDTREYKIGWSIWTGYMPFAIMEEKGFLATRA